MPRVVVSAVGAHAIDASEKHREALTARHLLDEPEHGGIVDEEVQEPETGVAPHAELGGDRAVHAIHECRVRDLPLDARQQCRVEERSDAHAPVGPERIAKLRHRRGSPERGHAA